MFTSAVTSMSRVSNMFGRSGHYQEHSDLFHGGDDHDQSWSVMDDKKQSTADRKLDPWSRDEAAQVKAMLDSELRRELPGAEAPDSFRRQQSQERSEKKRNRRRDDAGAAPAFDFPQDWLTPSASPVQRSAEPCDVWASVGQVGTSALSPQPSPAWPAAVKELKLPTAKDRPAGRSRANTDTPSTRSRPAPAPAQQFDEAILAALAALPPQSLVDVLQRLAERRPDEISQVFGKGVAANGKATSRFDLPVDKEQQMDFKGDNSPVSTATGKSPLLSPPAAISEQSFANRRAASANCSPAMPMASPHADTGAPHSAQSSPDVPTADLRVATPNQVPASVAEVVAAAADAAGPMQSPGAGWPRASPQDAWPSLTAEPQQDPWPSQLSSWPVAEAGGGFEAPKM